MAQADTVVVDNSSGQVVRGGFNETSAAALTQSYGATPPPDTLPGLGWRKPDGSEAVRASNNAAWLYRDTAGQADPPGQQHNEAAGYQPGSKWSTIAGQVYFHRGGGVWFEVGTGDGSGGGAAGGGGMFLNFLGVMRMTDTDNGVPVLGLDTSGRMRMVEDGA